MLFLHKMYVVLFCIFITNFSLATEREVFLLPLDDETLVTTHNCFQQLSAIAPLYEEIQLHKAHANIQKLIEIKQIFETLLLSEEEWKNYAQILQANLKNCFIWPEQSFQQCVGTALFYPVELKVNPYAKESLICEHPGIIASLAIAATYQDPWVMVNLVSNAHILDQKNEISITQPICKARAIFQKAASYEDSKRKRFAEYGLIYMEAHYEDCGLPSSYKPYQRLEILGPEIPEAYIMLGESKEREGDLLKAIQHYFSALKGGLTKAALLMVSPIRQLKYDPRLGEILGLSTNDTMSGNVIDKLYETARGSGLFSAALDKLHQYEGEEAKMLFEKSGGMGCLEGFIDLGDNIIKRNISTEKDRVLTALPYYQKADRWGNAAGSLRAASLVAHDDEYTEIAMTCLMQATRWEDIKVYDCLLDYQQNKECSRFISKTRKNLMSERSLLQQKKNLLFTLVKNVLKG